MNAGRVAALGTAELGGNVLEVQVTRRADLEKAASLGTLRRKACPKAGTFGPGYVADAC